MKDCKYKTDICCELNVCEPICIINVLTELYFDRYGFKEEGWYTDFQQTDIWKKAKELVLNEIEEKDICSYCNKEINGNPILHHNEYDYCNFFNLDYIKLMHKECHGQWHKENELPKWQGLPDGLSDLFNLDKDTEYLQSCRECGYEYVAKPYMFLCKKCYWDFRNQGIKPNWRDYTR